MTKSEIEKILTEWGAPFAIVANITTGEMEHIGDLSAIEPKGLVKALFYDAAALATLNASVQEHSYRTWNQGEVVCVVCKPTQNTIIGFFGKKRDPTEQYHWVLRLCEKVNAAWA